MKLSDWRNLKVRSDLVLSPQSHQGQLFYVIKDPLTLRYFRLRPPEYAIFRMLDGKTPIDDVRKKLATLGHDIPDDELQLFLRQLGAANFFENVLPNQAESLYQMATLRRTRKSLWSQAKRILYLKIPLVDPDRAFSLAIRHLGFLWSPWAYAGYSALVALALWIFFSNYQRAAAEFSGLLSPENLLAFWLLFILEKVFHELGHGLTCKRFGGEVHEMGLLVLVLTPCMYCNISDAWILEKPSRKFWISAAGIVTELLIASLAAILWYATPQGPLNSLSYRIMVLAGISSVLINGNPLMKWDGYYILSDLLGMPNLRDNSVRYIGQFFRSRILGMRVPSFPPWNRESAIKLLYGILSSAWIIYIKYRITAGLLIRFPALGVWILLTTLYGLILVPSVRFYIWLSKRRGGIGDIDLPRISSLAALSALGLYFLFLYDMGYSVAAPCVIQPVRRQTVNAPAEGILLEIPFSEGDSVAENQVLARLENRPLQLSLLHMLSQLESLDIQIDSARSAAQLVLADNLLKTRADLERSIDHARRRLDSLTIRSPLAGIILTPQPASQTGKLLLEGDLICEIGDLTGAKVTIAVPENDVRFITLHSLARVSLRAYPWRTFTGSVSFVSDAPLRVLPSAALSSRAHGPVVTRPDTASHVPLVPTYEVSILLDNPQRELLVGMVGKVKIESGNRRLFEILYTRALESIRRMFGLVT